MPKKIKSTWHSKYTLLGYCFISQPKKSFMALIETGERGSNYHEPDRGAVVRKT